MGKPRAWGLAWSKRQELSILEKVTEEGKWVEKDREKMIESMRN